MYITVLLIIFYYDVRQDVIDTTYGIVLYSSYHNCVFSLKMAYTATTCRWWYIINKVVSRLVFM